MSDNTHACNLTDRQGASGVGYRQPPHPRGEEHPCWKGDGAGYYGFHLRVRKARGKADHCVTPGCTSPGPYQWASISRNYADVMDYMAMCIPHHTEYDDPGAKRSGERNCNAKLTAEIVREARRRNADGMSGHALAAEYGVNVTTMCRALKRTSWRHVE